MFAVVERNNGTFQAVNVYGRRGTNFPTLWSSDPYSTEAQAERASRAKQKKKSRKGYVFLDAEEFRAFMAEHFNSETLNSSESIDNYMSESPLEESPVDEDPLTADPSDLGGPEDFSADASIDLEDGKITIHEKGVKSGSSKKLLLGVILVAGLAAAYQNSDAVLEFFEGLSGDESDPILGCMDETANNYDATATEDDGTCTYDPDDEPTA
jgi:predicted DNA-binding WGR domain protein